MSPKIWMGILFLAMASFLQSQEVCKDPSQARLVDLLELDATIALDLRYATANNFIGKQIYPVARCFLVRPAAEALIRVHLKLKKRGLGIRVFDAYRPHSCQKLLWQYLPDENFVAHPKNGSRHNRGCSVDVTLNDLATGQPVEMPSEFDDFSPRAFRSYKECSPKAIENRTLLETAMVEEGFIGLPEEWWHFDYHDWRKYPLLDVPLENVEAK